MIRRAFGVEWVDGLFWVYLAFAGMAVMLAVQLLVYGIVGLIDGLGKPDYLNQFLMSFSKFFVVGSGGLIGLIGVGHFFAALALRHRKNYRFIKMMAIVLAFFFPFGTILGLWTLFVLKRQDVKQLFFGERSETGALIV